MFGRRKIQSWTETIYLQIRRDNLLNTQIILTIIIIGIEFFSDRDNPLQVFKNYQETMRMK